MFARPTGALMPDRDQEKRERILRTAVQLFGKEGYHGTRMSLVASAARVSPKTLYRFFPGKKELFIAARGYATNRLVTDILSVLPEEEFPDALAVGQNLLKSYSGFIRKNRGLARILAEAVAIVDPDIRRDQREGFAIIVEGLGAVLSADMRKGRLHLSGDPDEFARLFLSFASLVAYAVLLDLDRPGVGGFDPDYALDLFFSAMSGSR
jgi:AcrR family transcriptional regulator